jgi:hypothetical protein
MHRWPERAMALGGPYAHHPTMRSKTHVRLYQGIIEAQAQERFRVHAAEMIQQGWHPSEWRWDGTALRVVYSRERIDPWAEETTSGSGGIGDKLAGLARLRRA